MGRRRRLLLTYDAAAVPDGGSAVYAKLSGLSSSYGKDPAGHIYHIQALRQAGLYEEELSEDEQASETESSIGPSRENSTVDFSSLGNGAAEEDAKWKGKGRKRKSKKQKNDLYALLGLQHERWMASDVQIRNAYKRTALEHHPDKQRAAAAGDEEVMAETEERFKAIQEAYETLSDAAKRREYDSLDPFDNSLPGEYEGTTPEGFYTHFGAAFRRNSKWSVNQPVPDLGEDDTDFAHVDAFYDFWFSFKSWREFPHEDEEDVESAECREERRWIERHNSKLREKGRKDEFRRTRDFVELAYRLDPRVQRQRDAQKAERERQKAEREAERTRIADEERMRIEEEAKKKAEEEEAAAVARKQRQIEKKAMQKERARLRKLCAADGAAADVDLPDDEVETLCSNLTLTSLCDLCNQLSATHLSTEDKTAAVEVHMKTLRTKEDEEWRQKRIALAAQAAAAAAAAKEEAEQLKARLRDWDEEEVRLLRKALDKFPPGTSRRWEQVQSYVRTRTVEEVLDMVKHGLKTLKYDGAPTASGPVIAKKRQANTVINSEATQRDESFTDLDVNIKGPALEVLSAPAPAAKAAPAAAPAPAAPAPAAPAAWTTEEEVALVKALKDVPKDAADRWDQVAAAVGTKNKIECGRRFKEMKQSYKAKKEVGA